ncbi:MAG: PEF-CTERM sorting domain-containing protein [Methanosarcina sp.]
MENKINVDCPRRYEKVSKVLNRWCTMKNLKIITMLPLSFLLLTLLSLPAMAYTIDGSLSDWGVDLNKAYSGASNANSGWIPHGHNNVDWIVENNIDPVYNTPGEHSYPDWTGYSSTGIHMKGTGETSVSLGPELKLSHPDSWSNSNNRGGFYLQPAGGEPYDIEALYFDDDAQNMYIAIVTSLPTNGHTDNYGRHTDPGDIAIDLNNNGGYEYGIKIDTGLIRRDVAWTKPTDFTSIEPYNFNPSSGQAVGAGGVNVFATLVYKQAANADESYPNYIIEASIPKSAIGNPTVGQTSNIHVTIGCGNDLIELIPVTFKTNIPEFPSMALPVAAILGVMFIFGNKKKE